MERIKAAKSRGDANALMSILHEGIHGNLGNISNPKLSQQSKLGTKKLIEEFLEQSVSKLRAKGIENITIDRKPVSAFIKEPESQQQPKRKPNNRQSTSVAI